MVKAITDIDGFGTQVVKVTCKTCAHSLDGKKRNFFVSCDTCRFDKETGNPDNYKEKYESTATQSD